MRSRLKSSYRAVLAAFATFALAVGMSLALAGPALATQEVPCDSTLSFALSTPFNNFGTTCFDQGGPPNSTWRPRSWCSIALHRRIDHSDRSRDLDGTPRRCDDDALFRVLHRAAQGVARGGLRLAA